MSTFRGLTRFIELTLNIICFTAIPYPASTFGLLLIIDLRNQRSKILLELAGGRYILVNGLHNIALFGGISGGSQQVEWLLLRLGGLLILKFLNSTNTLLARKLCTQHQISLANLNHFPLHTIISNQLLPAFLISLKPRFFIFSADNHHPLLFLPYSLDALH